ncbi:tetraspanin-32 isoform X1 [Lynx canadensis]|uniref:tetraspanin-32 isoform X1 n=1 Tax=Lynx canadensis TaxID=61383 RepID=UPI0011B01EE8|nr:tetraspanin-32 isoform X1 [Lynx canadensis]
MQSWSRVRVAKCQLLVTSSFVLLLGLSMAAMAAVNYLGTHFAVVGRASSDRTPYEATRRWAFCTSISLAGLLTLGAVLGAVATVREAGGLMAGGFLCFALAFCTLVQVAFWRFHNPAQVEDAVLDTYDLVYDQAVRSSSVTLRQQLVAIQDTFLCCGKNSPFGLLGGTEVSLCPGEEATRQGTQARLQRRGPSSWDHFQQPWEPEVPTSQPAEVSPAAQGPANTGADRCTHGRQASLPSPIPAFRTTSRMCFLSAAAPNANIFPRPKCRHLSASEMEPPGPTDFPSPQHSPSDCLVGVRSFLRTYGNIASTLTGIGLASTVYAVLLSSFLWFAFRSGCGLDRRGKYTLSRRARDCRPQEPSFFRRSPGGPALRHPMEADILDGRLRASRPSGGPQFLQDS